MPWQSQSPDLNPIEHLREILERRLRPRFPPPSTEHQIMEFLLEEWCRIPPIEFQTLVESMPMCTEAALANTLLRQFMLVFPLFRQLPVHSGTMSGNVFMFCLWRYPTE